MEFKFINDVIDGIALNLEILEKDAENYSMLVFQHKGIFSATQTKFGNYEDCTTKFNAFFNLAKEQNVSLALTPEYSCPWSSIQEIVGNAQNWPNNLKLWAIGCESISPDEIREFINSNSNDSTLIHFDESVLEKGNGVLLDPLIYLFRSNHLGEEKLFVIIQIKTFHMGVWESPAERDRYIPGDDIYVLRNSVSSIFLFTNICSEAANFSISNEFKGQLDNRWDENPYIILNPQMNPKPSNHLFRAFRKGVLVYPNKDIVSLNWGGMTMFQGKDEPLIALSKSSVFIKSEQIDFNDESRFERNHRKGLYYLNQKTGLHSFYLNPYKEVFYVRNQKPASSGIPGSMVRRTGPEVLRVWDWNKDLSQFEQIDFVDDGFINFLQNMNCNSTALNDAQISFIDKERLINLTCGKATSYKDDRRWYKLNHLESFVQDENEGIKRLTYIHDETGDDIRRDYIDYIDILNDIIIPDEEMFPENLVRFRGNCSEINFYSNFKTNYNYNLVTNDKSRKATVAYIGRNTRVNAMKTLEHLQNLFPKEDQSKKLVVVWYKEDVNKILTVASEKPPAVDDDSSVGANEITSV